MKKLPDRPRLAPEPPPEDRLTNEQVEDLIALAVARDCTYLTAVEWEAWPATRAILSRYRTDHIAVIVTNTDGLPAYVMVYRHGRTRTPGRVLSPEELVGHLRMWLRLRLRSEVYVGMEVT